MTKTALDDLEAVIDNLGGVQRSSQQAMVEAMQRAFEDGTILLVQAGTGTGKSLGYLVPAAHGVVAGGGRVVVSTATLALQRQLIDSDLPAVVSAIGGNSQPSFAVLKGRGNYLCQARVHGGMGDESEVELPLGGGKGALEEQAADLREWADSTPSGDRDDYPDRLDGRVWRSMSATGRECVGPTRCSFADECFSERAKTRAALADIVVTNHAYLALDAMDDGAYLPEHEILVVDEAHEFVARATSAATADLMPRGVERAMRLVRSLVDEESVARLSEALTGFEVAVLELGDQQQRLAPVPAALVDPVAALRDAAHVVVSAIPKDEGIDVATRHRATVAVEEVHDVAGRVLSADSQDVVWSGGSGAPGLHVAPLSVAGVISDRLARNKAAVLTSATLTLGGRFEPFARELGLSAESRDSGGADRGSRAGDTESGAGGADLSTGVDGSQSGGGSASGDAGRSGGTESGPVRKQNSAEITRWRAVDVGSPFDYGKQGILYVAGDLPRPGRDGPNPESLERMRELVEASGGRSLVLLSSWRAVDIVGDYLIEHVPHEIEVLVQRRGEGVATLVSEFAKDESSVLVGTMSLFQGVDVPGSTLQCVIIDRIPFPRPDDPILEARARQAEVSGGNGFMDVSVPRAALLLAQGSGRLIRRSTDMGVVAVLDSRLANARYGTYLLRSMPAFWRTTDRDVALKSLRRLASVADAAATPDAER